MNFLENLDQKIQQERNHETLLKHFMVGESKSIIPPLDESDDDSLLLN